MEEPAQQRPYYRSIHGMWPEHGTPRPNVERPTDSPFGARLRALRKAKGYTQLALGARCDVSQQEVARLERGMNRPVITTVRRLAEALGVSVTVLAGDTVTTTNPDAWVTFRLAVDGLRHALDEVCAAADALTLDARSAEQGE